jgi:hypothetical protein
MVKEAFWHLCMANAVNAKTSCIFDVYEDTEATAEPTSRLTDLAKAADQLATAKNGSIHIKGDWNTSERDGEIEFWYFKPLFFDATDLFITRVVENLIQFYIAKQLYELQYPPDCAMAEL